jgi:GNAT superfamily N-acetyltransferase
MSDSPYTFQKLDLEGLKTLVQWAEQEGWNPGPNDADVFWHTDPDGFYGFFDEEKFIAGGAIVSYDGKFGFMGLFIVHPDYRGDGIGRQLWYQRRDMLLQRLNPGASIGMDGVVSMQPFYRKGGFEIAFKDERYENTGIQLDLDPNISSINPEDFSSLLAYDKQCFGFNRSRFLEHWLQLPGAHTFNYKHDGELKGFAVLRKVISGYKIGPLFADDDRVAEALYRACLNAVPGQLVYLDIPLINSGAVELVKKYKAKYVFECARMYYGSPPESLMNKVYGITTFELG